MICIFLFNNIKDVVSDYLQLKSANFQRRFTKKVKSWHARTLPLSINVYQESFLLSIENAGARYIDVSAFNASTRLLSHTRVATN